MEAVGAGANVLAFVLLGIKCAKTIHNTLSIVRDGPSAVQRVSNTVLHLHWTLEQIKQSRAAADDVSLRGQTQHCVQYLSSLAGVIEKLQIAPSEKTTGKFWKRLRLVLDEKALSDIDGQVTQQATMLSLRLNVLSSNILYESREGDIRFGRRIEELDASIQTQRQCHTAGLSQLETNFSSNLLSHSSDMQKKLSALEQAIEARASISTQDTNSLQAILQEIRDHVVPISSRSSASSQSITGDTEGIGSRIYPHDTDSWSKNAGLDKEMMDCINQLSRLIDEKSRSIDIYADDDEQGTCIIEDMQSLLRTAQKRHESIDQMEGNARADDAKKLTKRLFDGQLSRFSRSFGQGELCINQGVNRKLGVLPNGVIHQTREYNKTDIGIGTLGLTMHKRTRPNTERDDDDDDDNGENLYARKRSRVDYEMTLTFVPKNRQRFHMFVASARQHELFGHGVSSVSRLVVNRVLPAGSLVFDLVRQGRLREFREMLKNGEASLRDHDEYGASLLSYSVRQPEVCKFLTDSGLDVDHTGYDTGVRNRPGGASLCNSTLQMGDWSIMAGVAYDEIARTHKCQRLLLEAGADPTIDINQNSNSFLHHGTLTNAPEFVRPIWNSDSTRYFADIRTFGHARGKSIFLQYCSNWRASYNKVMLKQLFYLGADIDDRDGDGRTCLHTCLYSGGILQSDSDPTREFEAVRYLVERGANVFAVDHDGRTVSDAAYTTTSNMWMEYNGSYIGDLWDSVLQSCGFDIAHFRSGHKRRAKYSNHYTREYFEKLWQGREAHCPYWDDSPWPPLAAEVEDSDNFDMESEEALNSDDPSSLDDEGEITQGGDVGGDNTGGDEDVILNGSPSTWRDNSFEDLMVYEYD